MFILHVSNTLQHSSANGITQIFSRRLGVYRPEVHRPIHTLHDSLATHHVRGGEGVRGGIGVERAKVGSSRGEGGRCDEGLGSGCLGLLCGSLLRLGYVRTAVFTIIYALASPVWFGGECIDDLGR